MIASVAELCDKALEYLLSISVGNKNATYSPSGSLKSGTVLKTYSFSIATPDVNTSVARTSTMSISTNESIPSAYLTAVDNAKITSDWNSYKTNYIYTKISSNTRISLSSMFLFLYLFRYFVDKKFCLFTDIYTQSSVWLYNTGTVTYSPGDMSLNLNSLDSSAMNTYMTTLINEITSRDTLKTLKASSSNNSCSSSSCSSSCSSSSSSSSCSSSSSSSSSLFIAYFNIG